ncbi:MAG TPA: caspase family protein, partial [Allocoleopsis sp.]
MNKVALLIGVSQYEPGFSPLPSALQDVAAMRQVLENPEIGGFNEVQELLNPEPQAMQEQIEIFFQNRARDDLVLLFFSGHGVKDERGRLYFATRITRKTERGELIKSTTVPASFIHDIMINSRIKRQIVILDCCFSGAFATDMPFKGSTNENISANIQEQLGAEGRAVLTSSSATQYSFEQPEAALSVYTRYLVEGL